MPRSFRIAYFAHALRSDWNNGNAHFLRGLLRALAQAGHTVVAFEPEGDWSIQNLLDEADGPRSLAQFSATYPDLDIRSYPPQSASVPAAVRLLLEAAGGPDLVILHEWNPPQLAHVLLSLRDALNFKLLFHDTHHRASSSPDSFANLGLARFDGVLAFGEALRTIYRERFGLSRVWTLHEAADTTVFKPFAAETIQQDVVWIGNWGDDERSSEIHQFLLQPAAALPQHRFTIFGVRYPPAGLAALRAAGVRYGGYLPNLDAPLTYARSRLTVHIPRQQYTSAMAGIPTIRVFEALACGIPLLSAPWQDSEHLFREGDFLFAHSGNEMQHQMQHLLAHPAEAASQAARGRETVLARHTCMHRAQELSTIFEELFS